MAEKYTYADVIIDPKDKRVEIGKEYFCDSFPFDVLSEANKDLCSSILKEIIHDSYEPFQMESGICFSCIIRKKEPEKKYVPFDLSKQEDRARLRGAWIKGKDPDMEYLIISVCDRYVVLGGNYPAAISSNQLLEFYEFSDGTPCGKLVEVNE